MKHIKDILASRQLSLFAKPAAKGGSEWSAFNAVVGDHVDAFPTRAPRSRTTGYGSVVRTHRVHNPHSLFPKRA